MAQIIGPNPGTVGQIQAYSVINHNGVSFTWTAQHGTIVSGQGTQAVTIHWNTSGPSNLEVLVTKIDNTTELTVIVIDVAEM